METLVIKDLPITHELAREEMKLVQGGQRMQVRVDGNSDATVDDFDLNMGIFSGRIGVTVV